MEENEVEIMNRIKGSVIAKIIAWLVMVSSGVTFLGSCIAVCILENYGAFQKTKEEVLERQLEEMSGRYSVIALDHYKNEQKEENEQYFSQRAFRYGIIEADSLDGINLNAPSTYLDRNFTGNVKKEDLHIFSAVLSDDAEIEYSEKLFGGYGIWGSGSTHKSLYADRICYDVTGGIFYYRAENQYYPVQNVSIAVRLSEEDGYYEDYYYFTFDNDKKVYLNQYAYAEMEETIEQPEETTVSEPVPTDEAKMEIVEETTVSQDSTGMELLQNEYEITFNMFDGTELDYTKWSALIFDDIRELDASELTLIDSKNMAKSSFVAVEEAYLDENYTLHVYEKNGKTKSYYVVSYIDETVLEAEKQEFLSRISDNSWDKKLEALILAENVDLYVLAEVFVDVLYEVKEGSIACMFGTFLLALVCFLFLFCAAGHRRNKEEIVPTFIDKFPLDILCTVVFFIEGIAASILIEISYSDSVELVVPFFVIMGSMMACLLMVTLLSFAVRVKMGKWWRNSLIYWIWTKIRKILRKIWHGIRLVYQNISILWKIIVGMMVYSILQIVAIAIMEPSNGDGACFLFFLEKLIICPVLILLVLQFKKLQEGSRLLAEGDLQHKIDTTKMFSEFKKNANYLNSISEGMSLAVDERMKSERFKTELITNVSHDIKTPLTSIINYVDLLEKTDIQDEKAKEYLEVLERQSARLKKLIEDLIEASKASTGNLPVNNEDLEANVFVTQILGEFEEKLANAGLELIINKPEKEIPVRADGRHLWRVVDNLMNNICKYAQPGSRVYINLEETEDKVLLTFRNMSKYPLNITSEELMERFVRGDSSRNTEGNGLGLSIAKSLMELMNGKLLLYVDGDLFKVVLEFLK